MTSWTTPKTWTASSALTAAELNEQVRDNLANVDERLDLHNITSESTLQPVYTARLGASVIVNNKSVSDSSDVVMTWASEEYDDADFMSGSNTRLYAPRDGTFSFSIWLHYEAHASGRREAWLELQAATQYNRVRLPTVGGGAGTAIFTSCDIPMTKGQYVQAYTRQTSGTSLDVDGRFQVRYIGD